MAEELPPEVAIRRRCENYHRGNPEAEEEQRRIEHIESQITYEPIPIAQDIIMFVDERRVFECYTVDELRQTMQRGMQRLPISNRRYGDGFRRWFDAGERIFFIPRERRDRDGVVIQREEAIPVDREIILGLMEDEAPLTERVVANERNVRRDVVVQQNVVIRQPIELQRNIVHNPDEQQRNIRVRVTLQRLDDIFSYYRRLLPLDLQRATEQDIELVERYHRIFLDLLNHEHDNDFIVPPDIDDFENRVIGRANILILRQRDMLERFQRDALEIFIHKLFATELGDNVELLELQNNINYIFQIALTNPILRRESIAFFAGLINQFEQAVRERLGVVEPEPRNNPWLLRNTRNLNRLKVIFTALNRVVEFLEHPVDDDLFVIRNEILNEVERLRLQIRRGIRNVRLNDDATIERLIRRADAFHYMVLERLWRRGFNGVVGWENLRQSM